ncbi:hypothetical protein [Gemmatimonas sp.]|uniref:hypothetical protein n=1 Tax=Gemmatimonas sp. TaxID=1962908 RepID=UPI0037C1AED6
MAGGSRVRGRHPRARAVGRSVRAACALLAAACAGEPRPSRDLAERFADPARHLVHIGLDGDTSQRAMLGVVLGARLTASGSHLVVLDLVPPHVKVFDRQGLLHAAFLEQGGGPAESKTAVAIAIAGDSGVLVAESGSRFQLFDLEGRLRGTLRATGISPLAVLDACGGAWMGYGPHFSGGRGEWLHALDSAPAASGPQWTFADALSADFIAMGRPYGAVRGRDSLFVWHELGAQRGVLTIPCTPGPARLRALDARDAPAPPSFEPTKRALAVKEGARISAGLAAPRDTVVIARIILGKSAESSVTELVMPFTEPRRIVRIPGAFVLRDSRPGVGVLVEAMEPVPQVFLMPEDSLLALFRR